MRAVILPALALLALLSGCGEKKSADGPERKTAAGEVLGGSISDAMLPLATVTSQSPPLREGVGSDEDEVAGGAAESAGDEKPEATPTATPEPSAAASASASATPQAED
jgi:hypothetical protein